MIGDSFACVISPGNIKAAMDAGVPGIVMRFSGWVLLLDVNEKALFRRKIVATNPFVPCQKNFRQVGLNGHWTVMNAGHGMGLFKPEGIWFGATATAGDKGNKHVTVLGFNCTVAAASRTEIVIVTGMPEQVTPAPETASLALRYDMETPERPLHNLRKACRIWFAFFPRAMRIISRADAQFEFVSDHSSYRSSYWRRKKSKPTVVFKIS